MAVIELFAISTYKGYSLEGKRLYLYKQLDSLVNQSEKLEGSYQAETPVNAVELTDMAKDVYKLQDAKIPANDPLQNSSKQCEGLGQNAYSTTSRYLPDTYVHKFTPKQGEISNTYKGAIAMYNCETPQEYAKECRHVAENALEVYKCEVSSEKMIPPAYLHGIINTVCEKFGFKVGIIEDTVAKTIENHTDLTEKTVDVENVKFREKNGHDLVFLDKDGKEVTVQVKTGGENKKNADYLAKVDMKMDKCEIEIEITT